MGSLSDYLENAILKHLVAEEAYTPPTIYVGLSTADPLDDNSGLSEPSGNGYTRVAHASWNAAASRGVSNNGQITFPAATGSWGTVTHVALFDASSGGNLLAHSTLAASRTISAGNVFAIADQEITIDFNIWKIYYTSGGTYEVQDDDAIEGDSSGATGTVHDVILQSGTWAGGDAAGYLWVKSITGTFQSETISVGANSNVATIDGDLIGGISNYLAHKMLDLIFSGTAYTAPSIYVGLSTANPEDDGGGTSEPVGNNYNRTQISSWRSVANGVVDNAAVVTLPTPSGSWGTVTHEILMDAATSGNLLYYGKLYYAQSPANGDGLTIPIGALNIGVDRTIPVTTTTTTSTTTTSSTTTTTTTTAP